MKSRCLKFLPLPPRIILLPMEALAPHQIRGMGLCICLAGEVRISIDLKHYTVHKGEMFIILPRVVIQPIGRSDDFVGYVLGLKPDRVAEIDSSVGLQFYLTVRDNPCLALHDGDLQTLLELCDLIKKEIATHGTSLSPGSCRTPDSHPVFTKSARFATGGSRCAKKHAGGRKSYSKSSFIWWRPITAPSVA